MDFKEYIEKYNPKILKEFELHEKGWEVLKVGMKLRTLRAGFCGGAGEIRYIAELGTDKYSEYAKLSNSPTSKPASILYKKVDLDKNDDGWWKCVEIVEEN
jgi:hypothetical protein